MTRAFTIVAIRRRLVALGCCTSGRLGGTSGGVGATPFRTEDSPVPGQLDFSSVSPMRPGSTVRTAAYRM